MPSIDVHVTQVQHNESVASSLAAIGHFDWAITALFYAALNLMQAYLLEKGIVAETHAKRREAINSQPELASISRLYTMLQTQSENARYNCERFDEARYTALRSGEYATLSTQPRELRSERNNG